MRKRHQASVDLMIDRQGHRPARRRSRRSAGAAAWGFIEENRRRAAHRDARITTIYEGTTGIQANDLIGRKTARDGGAVAR
jgi:alkylation response protein AidB-like acyl-CoA dehydrogenase